MRANFDNCPRRASCGASSSRASWPIVPVHVTHFHLDHTGNAD